MRGLFFFVVMAGLVPLSLAFPYAGVLTWVWVSIMNPHQLVYGPFAALPYALIVAIGTLIAWILAKEPKKLNGDALEITILVLMVWISFTSLVGLAPSDVLYDRWLISIKMLF